MAKCPFSAGTNRTEPTTGKHGGPGGKFLGLKIKTEYKINNNNANKIKIIIVPSSISFSEEIRNTNKNKVGDCIRSCYVWVRETDT